MYTDQTQPFPSHSIVSSYGYKSIYCVCVRQSTSETKAWEASGIEELAECEIWDNNIRISKNPGHSCQNHWIMTNLRICNNLSSWLILLMFVSWRHLRCTTIITIGAGVIATPVAPRSSWTWSTRQHMHSSIHLPSRRQTLPAARTGPSPRALHQPVHRGSRVHPLFSAARRSTTRTRAPFPFSRARRMEARKLITVLILSSLCCVLIGWLCSWCFGCSCPVLG